MIYIRDYYVKIRPELPAQTGNRSYQALWEAATAHHTHLEKSFEATLSQALSTITRQCQGNARQIYFHVTGSAIWDYVGEQADERVFYAHYRAQGEKLDQKPAYDYIHQNTQILNHQVGEPIYEQLTRLVSSLGQAIKDVLSGAESFHAFANRPADDCQEPGGLPAPSAETWLRDTDRIAEALRRAAGTKVQLFTRYDPALGARPTAPAPLSSGLTESIQKIETRLAFLEQVAGIDFRILFYRLGYGLSCEGYTLPTFAGRVWEQARFPAGGPQESFLLLVPFYLPEQAPGNEAINRIMQTQTAGVFPIWQASSGIKAQAGALNQLFEKLPGTAYPGLDSLFEWVYQALPKPAKVFTYSLDAAGEIKKAVIERKELAAPGKQVHSLLFLMQKPGDHSGRWYVSAYDPLKEEAIEAYADPYVTAQAFRLYGHQRYYGREEDRSKGIIPAPPPYEAFREGAIITPEQALLNALEFQTLASSLSGLFPVAFMQSGLLISAYTYSGKFEKAGLEASLAALDVFLTGGGAGAVVKAGMIISGIPKQRLAAFLKFPKIFGKLDDAPDAFKIIDEALERHLKNLDNTQQAAFFKDLIEGEQLLDEVVKRPELVEAWRVLKDNPTLRVKTNNLEVLNQVKAKFTYNGKRGQEALEEIFLGHRSAQKLIDNLKRADELYGQVEGLTFSAIKSSPECRVTGAGIELGKLTDQTVQPGSLMDAWKILTEAGETTLRKDVEQLRLVTQHLDEINKAGGYKAWKLASGLAEYAKLRSHLGNAQIKQYLSHEQIRDLENTLRNAHPDVLKHLDQMDIYDFAEMARGYRDLANNNKLNTFENAIKSGENFYGKYGWLSYWKITPGIKYSLTTIEDLRAAGKLLPVGEATDIELACLQAFTRSGDFVNVPMRYNPSFMGEYAQKGYQHILNCLEKLRKVTGRKVAGQIVYSGKTYSKADFERLFMGGLGKKVEYKSFISTSKEQLVAEGFVELTKKWAGDGEKVAVIQRITTKNGVFINDLSDWGEHLGSIRHADAHPSVQVQEEVLLNPGYLKQKADPVPVIENGIHKEILGMKAYYVDLIEE
ncbi:MAG: hypothetical protein HC880_06700 [Bacteroidia bacterium]|nr:hypothetical protein [Bacteroidia bacterium]